MGEVCQLDLAETFGTLANTQDPGVVRLSANADSSGAGANVEFAIAGTTLSSSSTPTLAGLATGCATSGSGTPPAPAQAELIVATGNDTIRGDSGALLRVFGSNAMGGADMSVAPFIQVGIPSGNQSGDVFRAITAVPSGAPPSDQWRVVLTLTTHNSFPESDDHWDVGGVSVLTWAANGPEQCVLAATGDPAVAQLLGDVTLPAGHCD